MNGNELYYVQTWKNLFSALLGWSDSETDQWIVSTGKDEYLSDPDDLIYHQPPLYWAAEALVPETLAKQLSPLEQVEARNAVLGVFANSHGYEFPLDTDWSKYKPTLDVAFARYATSSVSVPLPAQVRILWRGRCNPIGRCNPVRGEAGKSEASRKANKQFFEGNWAYA